MKVIWQPSAKKGRTEVAAYIRRQFGAKRKISFLQEVRETTQMLRKVPNIGKIDPTLCRPPADLPQRHHQRFEQVGVPH